MCAGLCNAGDFEKGDTFLPHDESKLGIFMNELMRSGKPNMAIRVFGKYTQGENAIAPSIVTMNILLKALDRANRFAEAQEVFLQLKQERNARTYQIYTAILARRKKTDELVRVAQMMLKGKIWTLVFLLRRTAQLVHCANGQGLCLWACIGRWIGTNGGLLRQIAAPGG